MTDTTSEELTRSHWYWRPGWRHGRSFYTWHITFDHSHTELADVMNHYRPVIDTLPHLDPLPFDGLHLTVQGVGFTDEVEQASLARLVAEARQRFEDVPPFEAVLGPADTDAEGLFLTVAPWEKFDAVRGLLRSIISDVLEEGSLDGAAAGFTPHITLAYSNGVTPLARAQAALAAAPALSVQTLIQTVALIELNRDRRRYEWREIDHVILGSNRG